MAFPRFQVYAITASSSGSGSAMREGASSPNSFRRSAQTVSRVQARIMRARGRVEIIWITLLSG